MYIPFAVMLVVITCTVSLNDDGLLKISSGRTIPVFSSIEYFSLSKLTVIAIRGFRMINYAYKYFKT